LGFYIPSIFDLPAPSNDTATSKPVASRGRHHKRSGAALRGTLANWVSGIVSARLAETERGSVSARAWDLYTNDAMAHGIIEGMTTEVVGIGLSPQPQPMTRWLKRDQVWQEQYQQAAYDTFEIWGLDPRNFCDATRRMNIYMLQVLAYFHWKLDGIGLFQPIMVKDPYRPFSLSILPIDPSRLTTPTDAPKTEDIYDGVVIDKYGAIEAAYIQRPTTAKWAASFGMAQVANCDRIPAYNPKTGFPNLLFVCDVRNVAEYRQDSILGSMIKELRDSGDFVNAALVKALVSNLFTVFIQDETGQSAVTTWEDRIQELEQGTMIMGAAWEKPHIISSDAPGPNFDTMNESIIGRLGMATGRGPENVTKAYKASYSASQASIENAEKLNNFERMVLVNRFCQPIEMIRQYEAALRGYLPVSSIEEFRRPENWYAYTRTDWLPPPMRPIDKVKAAKADEIRLQNRTITYSDLYAEKGKDWRVALRQSAQEQAYISALEEEYGVRLRPEPKQGEGQTE